MGVGTGNHFVSVIFTNDYRCRLEGSKHGLVTTVAFSERIQVKMMVVTPLIHYSCNELIECLYYSNVLNNDIKRKEIYDY